MVFFFDNEVGGTYRFVEGFVNLDLSLDASTQFVMDGNLVTFTATITNEGPTAGGYPLQLYAQNISARRVVNSPRRAATFRKFSRPSLTSRI